MARGGAQQLDILSRVVGGEQQPDGDGFKVTPARSGAPSPNDAEAVSGLLTRLHAATEPAQRLSASQALRHACFDGHHFGPQ